MYADIKQLLQDLKSQNQTIVDLYRDRIAMSIDDLRNRDFRYLHRFKIPKPEYRASIFTGGFSRVWKVWGYSSSGSALYLHLYDRDQLPVNGERPDQILKCAADDNFGLDFSDEPYQMERGIMVVMSTTALTTTMATTAEVQINALYLPEAPPERR